MNKKRICEIGEASIDMIPRLDIVFIMLMFLL